MLMSGQVVTWISTLILAAAYGRFLGATGFGELYLATTFTSLVGFPIEFSFNQQLVRDVAREPEAAHRYITMALTLKAALWIVLFILSLVLAVLLGYEPKVRLLIVISGVMLVTTAISTTLISIQTAYMQVGMAKFGAVIEKVLDAVLVVLLLRHGADVIAVGVVLLIGSTAGMIWQIIRTMRMIGIRFEWDTQVARTLIRSGMAFLAYGVIGVIYYRVDTILLSVYATSTAIGVYGAAYKLFDTMTFIPGIVVGSVMSPILAKYSVDADKRKLRLAVEKSTMAMLLCALPAAAGMIVVAPNIIGFVYQRSDFTGSERVLQALAFGMIALYLNSVLTTVLVSTGQERKMPLMAIAALIFNVGLNLFVIPRYMEMGAAWATTATEVLLLGIGLFILDRSLIPISLLSTTAKIFAASVLMAVVAFTLNHYTIVVIIPIAGLVYAIAIWFLRVIPEEDIEHFKPALARVARFIPQPVLALIAGRGRARVAPELALAGGAQLSFAVPTETASATLERTASVALDGDPDGSDALDDADQEISAEMLRLNARSGYTGTSSVPLNTPVRIPSGLLLPLYRRDDVKAPGLQRRMRRRLAMLDARQVAPALAHAHLGHLDLRVRRIEPSAEGDLTGAQTRDPDYATLFLHHVMAQIGRQRSALGIVQIDTDAPRPATYCLEVHRQRPPKRSKDKHAHRGRRDSGGPATDASRASRVRGATVSHGPKPRTQEQAHGELALAGRAAGTC